MPDEAKTSSDRRDRSRSPRSRPPRRGGSASKKGSDLMVYVSNIPYTTRWMELKDLIREKAGDVSFVELLETPDGKSKGAAVVEFKDREGFQRCLDVMHRMTLGDRQIVAKEIRDPERFFRKVKEDTGLDFMAGKGGFGLPSGDRGSSGGPRGPPIDIPPTYETYGLSPSFLRQLNIEGPLSNRVFVANFTLPPSKVRELFSLAGKVTEVDLYLDKDGKSKGIFIVEYSHPIEAVQAISMLNNQKFHDRTLVVKMDKHEKRRELAPGELPAGLKSVGMGLGANGQPLTNVAEILSQSGSGGGGGGATIGAPGGSGGMIGGGGGGAMGNVGGMMNAFGGGVGIGMGGGGPAGGMGGMGGNAYAAGSNGMASAMVAPLLGGGGGRSEPSAPGYGMGGLTGGTGRSMARDVLDDRFVDINPGSDRWRSGSNAVTRLSVGGPGQTIYIKNLPFNFSWQKLKDMGREAGDVDFVEMIGQDVGKIRYKSVEDANRALRGFNGYVLEGRQLLTDRAD